jgi:CIC family chloride channel protein
VVATVVSRWLLGNHPSFAVPEYDLGSPLELFLYMAVGVLAGLVGTAFVKLLYFTEDTFDRSPLPEWTKAASGGLLVGLIGLAFPHVFGVGYSTISDALHGQLPLLLLFVLLFAKLLATCITIGSGGSGGILAPSLFLGAMTGGFFGTLVNQWFPHSVSSEGAYALVTMGAMAAATTQAPLSAMIIIFELTQTIDIIPPVMAACVVSTLIAMRLSKGSIYTLKLIRRGIDIHREDDPNVLRSLFVRDIVDKHPAVVKASAGLDEILSLLVETDHTEIFVVDERGALLGAIYFRELRRLILEHDHLAGVVVASDLLERGRPTVTEEDDLDLVMQLFSIEEIEELAVVDPERPLQLVGSVHKRDVINAYNQEVMRRDLAGGVQTTVGLVGRVHQVDLGAGFVVQEIEVPRAFVGRTLRELALRETTGVQVILRRKAGDTRTIDVPGPDEALAAGTKLIVAGRKEDVDRLAAL